MSRPTRSLPVLALLVTLFAVAPSGRAEPGARRIITLGSDITEIVYSLGEAKRLVGRDATSTYPLEAEKLPDVAYFRQLGAEGVLSLEPDLILASALAGPEEALQQIASAGVRIVRMPERYSEDGLLDKIGRVAEALDVVEKGETLRAELSKRIAEAKAKVAALPGRPKVLFIINAGGGAPMAAGRRTSADALIALAGSENVFGSHDGYKAVSLEAAAAASPDAIALMAHTLEAMGGEAGITAHPALRLTPAARQRRIIVRDGGYLLGFGPRLPGAILDFARAVRGGERS